MRVLALVTLITAAEGRKQSHPPGSVVEIEPGEAEALIARRFAMRVPAEGAFPSVAAIPAPAEPEPPAVPGGDASTEGAAPAGDEAAGNQTDGDRIAAIVDAMALLDRGNPAHFTNTGKPELRALADVLGWRPTATERDEAVARAEG